MAAVIALADPAGAHFPSNKLLGFEFGDFGHAPGWSQALPGNGSRLGAPGSSLAHQPLRGCFPAINCWSNIVCPSVDKEYTSHTS